MKLRSLVNVPILSAMHAADDTTLVTVDFKGNVNIEHNI